MKYVLIAVALVAGFHSTFLIAQDAPREASPSETPKSDAWDLMTEYQRPLEERIERFETPRRRHRRNENVLGIDGGRTGESGGKGVIIGTRRMFVYVLRSG